MNYLVAAVIVLGLLTAAPAQAASVAERVSGRIMLDVENHGEAWYVYPFNNYRYYLGRPDDAFDIMRYLSLGITDADLARFDQDEALRQRLSGWILLQVEQNGEAWYVNPTDLKRYYLGRPDDAFDIMGGLGLGITAADLATIPISDDFLNIAGADSDIQSFSLSIARGSFDVEVITLKRSAFTMVTDTGNTSDCSGGCAAKSLASYVQENNGTFGIHGTYFCPPDYASCAGQTNSFLPPVFNSAADVMINADKLPFHAGPMIAVGANDEYYYFHRTIDFGYSVEEFESEHNTQLVAAIANYPALVENGSVIVESESTDSKQQAVGVRGAIGYNDDNVFLVVAHSASVIDMGYIMDSLGANWAINLDGGGSAALYAEGSYLYGPGRELPNAIIFQ
ncbi:MAG: phosphodiester glycosidase family protein [Candidatus Kerfeldbacteria bacterium]|nr:phosphodiester glycosidase family protein [Candidatus Kerfeldbacteria bacterium]